MNILETSERIHPTVVISSDVVLHPDVAIGPYALIEGPVEIGAGCAIEGHACLTGPLILGRDNQVGHGAVLGKSPQHRGDRGDDGRIVIGDRNIFREYVTVHRGTNAGGGETVIGNDNMFMVGSHLGHDVKVGNHCTLVNYAVVGGHGQLDDGCILSGHTAVQQRVRVGRLAMISGLGATSKDVPPFILQQGYNCVCGLNLVGLRRAGVGVRVIDALRTLYRIVYRSQQPLVQSLDQVQEQLGHVPEVMEYLTFVRQSQLGINPIRDQERASWHDRD